MVSQLTRDYRHAANSYRWKVKEVSVRRDRLLRYLYLKFFLFLLTDKDEVPPAVRCLALLFENVFSFSVIVNPPGEIKTNFSISAFPHLMVMKDLDTKTGEFHVIGYDRDAFGSPTLSNFVKYLLTLQADFGDKSHFKVLNTKLNKGNKGMICNYILILVLITGIFPFNKIHFNHLAWILMKARPLSTRKTVDFSFTLTPCFNHYSYRQLNVLIFPSSSSELSLPCLWHFPAFCVLKKICKLFAVH